MFSLSSLAQVPFFSVNLYDSASIGFYFLSGQSTPMILDHNGNVVYYETGIYGNDFKLQPNGLMSYSQLLRYYLMDSTFTIVDSVEAKNVDQRDTHDLQILPNGHFLLLGSDLATMDLSQYYFDGQYGSSTAIVNASVVQEQDANKNVVFEWHTKDYFAFDDADTFFLYQGPVIDWTHSNAVELDDDGNILLSSRNLDEITKINRADSSIMWRLGGRKNQFTFANSPVPFYAQHDIRRIGNGNITLYDNGENYVSHGVRALEFDLDEINKVATLAWSYTYDPDLYSYGKGNVQRLANSNTLVNFGNTYHLNDSVGFIVVDSNGSGIFKLNGLVSYRAFNYPSLPWQLHRPQITCFESLGVTYLDAGAGHASYAWNNGDTTRIIAIAAVPGSYSVFVPYGQNGFISSEQFIVTDTSNLCSALAVAEIKPNDQNHFHVFPNPVHDFITVSIDAKERTEFILQLSDAEGRKLQSSAAVAAAGKNHFRLDLTRFAKGVYLLNVQSAWDDRKIKVVVE
jgi:hypothetical protein